MMIMWAETLKNGKTRYAERYTDALTGKQKRVSVTLDGKDTPRNRRTAADLLAEKIGSTETKGTLAELYKAYMAYQRNTVKASTYERNERTLAKLVRTIGEDVIVERLSSGEIVKRLMQMDCSNVTRNEYIVRLKTMFRWGLQMDLHNNGNLLKLSALPTDTSRRERIADKYLEPSEAYALLDYFEEHRLWKWYHVTKIMLLSGLRIGELVALDDADIDASVIHVNKTYDHINGLITTTKTATSTRDVYIQDELADAIRAYRLWRREELFRLGFQTPLFAFSSNRTRLNYYSFNKSLKEASKSVLGGKRVTTHTLRHAHASLLLSQGITVDEISRRLGHTDSRITRQVYLHMTEELKKKDNERFNSVRLLG